MTTAAPGRTDPPIDADEWTTLVAFLDYNRQTVAWKARGLDDDALHARLAPSSMTLGGMLKHLAYVEDHWFTRMLSGAPSPAPWHAVDWRAQPEWDWESAEAERGQELFDLWERSVRRSDAALRAARARGGLEQPTIHAWPDGRSPSLRWVLVHMIEEYARHAGHADLIRESIDGAVGE